MGKLLGLFGGSSEEGPQAEAEASDAPEPAAAEPAPISEAPQPVYVETNPYASIDDYAASLPAPDYVDPAGKASAGSEAA